MPRLKIHLRTLFFKLTLTSDDIAKRLAEAEHWPPDKRDRFARQLDALYSEYFAGE